MSQDERRAKRVGKVVLQLYRKHAATVADAAESLRVSCKEGCSHCCMLPATATIPEMVPVEYLTTRSDWTHTARLLPATNWSRIEVSDKTITTTIKHQIPDWF